MTMQLSHGFAPNEAKCPLLAQIHEWIAVPGTKPSHARMHACPSSRSEHAFLYIQGVSWSIKNCTGTSKSYHPNPLAAEPH